MNEALHKEFETTYRACFPIAAELQPNLFSFELDDGEYVEAKVHVAFTLWQAARATAEQSRDGVIEECCAAIKSKDDLAADDDYMLDSNDCIKVCCALKSQQDAAIESQRSGDGS